MTPRLDDILRVLPGLTEADVADLVEGTVPPAREALIIDALEHEPRLGLLVKKLRADRALLESLSESVLTAPPGMIETVGARLEREALRALVDEADHVAGLIPISSVQPRRRGVLAVLAESRWSRSLATAASLAIIAGLGYLGFRGLASKWPRLPGGVPVATNARTPTTPSTAEPAPGPSETLAAGDEAAASPVEAGASHESSATLAKAEPGPAELTPAEALRLAEAGRLVVTIRSHQYASTLRHLEGLSQNAGPGARWRSYEPDRLPTELAALAAPLPGSVADTPGVRPASSPQPPTMASDHGADGPATPAVAPAPGAELRVVVRTLRVVHMNADAARLAELLRDLNISKDHAAEFRILPAPLDQRPALDAPSVLWWSAGPDAWTRKVSVPIVVETVE